MPPEGVGTLGREGFITCFLSACLRSVCSADLGPCWGQEAEGANCPQRGLACQATPTASGAGLRGLVVPGAGACVCSVRLEGALPALHTQPALFWGQGEGTAEGQLSGEQAGPRPRAPHNSSRGPVIYGRSALALGPAGASLLDKWGRLN